MTSQRLQESTRNDVMMELLFANFWLSGSRRPNSSALATLASLASNVMTLIPRQSGVAHLSWVVDASRSFRGMFFFALVTTPLTALSVLASASASLFASMFLGLAGRLPPHADAAELPGAAGHAGRPGRHDAHAQAGHAGGSPAPPSVRCLRRSVRLRVRSGCFRKRSHRRLAVCGRRGPVREGRLVRRDGLLQRPRRGCEAELLHLGHACGAVGTAAEAS